MHLLFNNEKIAEFCSILRNLKNMEFNSLNEYQQFRALFMFRLIFKNSLG